MNKFLIAFLFALSTSAMAWENCGDPSEATVVDIDVAMYDEAFTE